MNALAKSLSRFPSNPKERHGTVQYVQLWASNDSAYTKPLAFRQKPRGAWSMEEEVVDLRVDEANDRRHTMSLVLEDRSV